MRTANRFLTRGLEQHNFPIDTPIEAYPRSKRASCAKSTLRFIESPKADQSPTFTIVFKQKDHDPLLPFPTFWTSLTKT